jgi:glutamate/tyrosine decarboxylase-like PLP-dependent enzyme
MSESLQLSSDEMRKLGYRVIDMIVDHVERLPEASVGKKGSRIDLARELDEPVPEAGQDPHTVLDIVKNTVLDNILSTDHPRFFGFIPSPSNYMGVLADALAAGFNVFAGTWLEGSGPAQIELTTLDWLRQICGLPETAGGLFVSGGSAANLTALALARDLKLRKSSDLDRGLIYYSDQTHASMDRGLRVLGFKTEQIRRIESDEAYRLPLTALKDAIALDRSKGQHPFCVVANAGTTSTGTVDPIRELVELCRTEDLWLHVDGAYGAAAVISDEGRRYLEGLGEVDSVSLDPHKWLFQPYEIGCVLVRDRHLLPKIFHTLPEYLIDTRPAEEELNFYNHGIQLTRGFRALKLWLSLKTFGLENFRKAIDRGLELARVAESRVRESATVKLISPAQMGILAYRFEPPVTTDMDIDRLNEQIVDELVAEGTALVSSTVLKGRTVLHMCTINPRTTERDIQDTIAHIEAIGARLLETNGSP